MGMAVRFWVYSVLSFLGAVALGIALLWLNDASSKRVNISAPPLPALDPGTPLTASRVITERNEVDAILAIDFSGSMIDNPGTDPKGYRLKAAELMATSLASDVFPRATRMGYISFANGARLEQPLQPVEDLATRKALISKIWKRFQDRDYGGLTEIDTAFELAYQQFFSGTQTSKNTPALILLTDGEPIGFGQGKNAESGLRDWVQKLTDKGVLVTIVILRPDVGIETKNLTAWRDIWNGIADKNPKVVYAETRDQSAGAAAGSQSVDEQLELIYNKIRGRLVNEGTKPGERQAYDPLRGSAIKMPPNLLQANLLISKPTKDTVIDLVSPDGKAFSALLQANKANEFVDGDLYIRYRIAAPSAGNWTIRTSYTSIIYYVLNTESLFRPTVNSRFGAPYMQRGTPTPLFVSVVDDKGLVSKKQFKVEAATLKNVKLASGAIVEQETPVSVGQLRPDGITYEILVKPEMIGPDGLLHLQLSGQASDGSLLNTALIMLPEIDLPTGVKLSLPAKVTCLNEQLIPNPPAIRCANSVTATLEVIEAQRLVPASLTGMLYAPGTPNGEPMTSVSNQSLRQTVSGLTTAGTYGINALARGKVRQDLNWSDSASGSVEVVLPGWVDDWKRRLPIGIVLFAILALWKPLLVPILLRVMWLVRLAPSGYFSYGDDGGASPVFKRAVQGRRLFVLTVARFPGPAADIKIIDDFLLEPNYNKRGLAKAIDRVSLRLRRWLLTKPLGRIYSVPFVGLHYETGESGAGRAPDGRPAVIRFGKGRLMLSQKDWTQK